MKTISVAITIALATSAMGQQTAAQQATPPYGAPISLEQAKKVIAAAEAEAEKNKWFVAITVVDSGGYLVATHRLDNTQLGSISYAQDKPLPSKRSLMKASRPPEAPTDRFAVAPRPRQSVATGWPASAIWLDHQRTWRSRPGLGIRLHGGGIRQERNRR
jgi:uncharacterized protein GlcG (DUF336 family)